MSARTMRPGGDGGAVRRLHCSVFIDALDKSLTVSVPQRRQFDSPEPSSLFDLYVIDTSQATTITEPDVVRSANEVSHGFDRVLKFLSKVIAAAA
ncbi:hypothetical protein CONLIGDRAFT_108571 [Coniochaeta ligniaria NRRL 30616]|uniref:Uncharacterized protein n=1 Tax=Coniochaeta ligniaria NRRL 30616 TaxID=1408157 RepID=A0A1J7J592_9PEZI|nr:hypothetical protein CONLIGDRAFT_108571 [Coniochaeta ligniaria NRRL 30616]